MSEPLRVAIVGAAGRMGRELTRLATADPAFEVGALVVASADEVAGIPHAVWGPAAVDAIAKTDVVIDFSSAAGLLLAATAAQAAGVPLVSGTTGIGDDVAEKLGEASTAIAVMFEPNFSVAVHLLAHLTELASRSLPDFDVEIIEAHHRHKGDAPSGTALFLLDAAVQSRPDAHVSDGRAGAAGPRKASEIGMHAVRGGSIVGEHTVMLCGEGERIELVHRAQDRAIFARGALRAAAWLSQQPRPGAYQIRHMLFGIPEDFGQ